MAVSKMKLINIIGKIDALDNVIFACGAVDAVQPDNALTFFSDASDFTTVKEENPYLEQLGALEAAATRLGSELTKVNVTVTPDIDRAALSRFVGEFSDKAAELSREKSELSLKNEAISRDLEQFEHFRGLGINLDEILNCRMIKIRFGRLPKDSYEKLSLYDDNPYVIFFTSMCDNEYYWGVYFAPLEFADVVDHIFSGLYFERLRIPAAIGTPDEIVENLRDKLQETRKKLAAANQAIRSYREHERKRCIETYWQLRQLSYYFSVRCYAARYHKEFILTCWVPEKNEKTLCDAFEPIDGIEYTVEIPNDPHHTPPVRLHNAKMFRPFEFFVNMYGLPRYNEIDPTVFVCMTYIILFGMMFGDVGQGIVVSIIGWLMWRIKKMEIGRILIPCGISSTVFGAIFGSIFGFEHVFDSIYESALGLHEKPIEVLKPSQTPIILLGAAGIGLCLIVAAMLMNIYSSLRRRDFEEGVFGPNGISGLIFYASLVYGIIMMLTGTPVMTAPYIIFLIVIPLFLIFMREPLGKLAVGEKNWKPEKFGEFCVQNFFELFECMLSYMSNTMSFLRVGAFVLVHAGMMMAVFTLAELTGGISYWIIVVLGNCIVILMEGLLVAIQVMRLEFYEMFSRYYKGDGRPFRSLDAYASDKIYSGSEP